MSQHDDPTGLRLEQLQINLADTRLVNLDLHIRPGEIACIMGPSGSGKSSLLAAIAGTLAPAFTLSGRILLNGKDLQSRPPHQRRVGLLFQDDLLFPHMSVADNLAFGLTAGTRGAERRRSVVEQALQECGLAGLAERYPDSLSGGQRSRVALYRTLLAEPDALLLDEPFNRLDQALRASIRELVFSRARERRLPTLLVTHDPDDATAARGPILSPLGQPL